MAILGQFPPHLIFTIGILRPLKWLRAKTRRQSRKKRRGACRHRQNERDSYS
jgi:hypothetical protein